MSKGKLRSLNFMLLTFLVFSSISYSQSALITDSTELEPGWYESDWLWAFYVESFPLIYSADLDWVLVENDDGVEKFWFYLMTPDTWAYTTPELYPWMYFDSTQSWVYLFLDTDPLLLYDTATETVRAYTGESMPTIVTVAFYVLNTEGEEPFLEPLIDPFTERWGMIAFDMSEDVFYWSRMAEPDNTCDEECSPGGHPHYNAAADMFYRDGVFSWVEYGPEHSEDDIRDLVAAGTAGTRKAVTEGTDASRFYLDHSGLYLQIFETE
ncbi:hypothetical protein [Rubellicoccus peritrichatus]|uniref:Uncharacterized protein n=1 Tax=Rubellicoccus peritrichatus TaxID=3080537 RepID=A0AAQ3QXR9_9BACT|nr:hypothetical protein [Puniceicoccus sp. CR14]WOO43322.1 hypothetical protein RZN69_09490 [Puniceicoccus sp. CR14]